MMAPNKKRSQESADVGAETASARRHSKPRLPTPKKLIFCFDGTGNDEFRPGVDPKNPNKDGGDALTNVAKLHLFFGGDFRADKGAPSFYGIEDQMSLYYSGVGTDKSSDIQSTLEFAFATQDVDKIINEGLEDLRKFFNPGDTVFVTGFSRGAAIARKFCSVVAKQDDLKHVEVEYLFVFDTVASFGFPDVSTEHRPPTDDLFEDKKVAPNVKKALHCVSIDEKRRHYQPTLMNDEPKVTEIWFSGVHSDIGGGYIKDRLSDVTLQFVMDSLKESENRFDLRVLTPDEVKYDEINKATPTDESGKGRKLDVDPEDLSVDPDPLGTIHTDSLGNGLIARLLRDDRKVVVLRDDKIVNDKLPIVHHSVAKRIRESEYRPPGMNTKHLLLDERGLIKEMSGLEEYYAKSSKRSLNTPTTVKGKLGTDFIANAAVPVS